MQAHNFVPVPSGVRMQLFELGKKANDPTRKELRVVGWDAETMRPVVTQAEGNGRLFCLTEEDMIDKYWLYESTMSGCGC